MGIVGAILGDISGSQYEFKRPLGFDYKSVELFDKESFFYWWYSYDISNKIRNRK